MEVPRKNLTVDNSTNTLTNTTDANAGNASEESSEKLETNNGNGNSSDPTANDSNNVNLGTEKKLKRRTFRVPLKVFKNKYIVAHSPFIQLFFFFENPACMLCRLLRRQLVLECLSQKKLLLRLNAN